MNHDRVQNSEQQLEWLEHYFLSLIDTFAANEELINTLSSYADYGNFGKRLSICFQSLTKNIKEFRAYSSKEIFQKLAMLFSNLIGGYTGNVLSDWFLKIWELVRDDVPFNRQNVIPVLDEATTYIKNKHRLCVTDKSFYTIWQPVLSVMKNNVSADMPTFLNLMSETAQKALTQSKELRSKTGRANYLGERSIGLIDPGVYATYLSIQTFIENFR